MIINHKTHSTQETVEFGRKLGAQLKGGEIIAISGILGAGKTHLIKGIAAGLEADENEIVTSPTFVLVNEYRRLDGGKFFHLDGYRLKDAEEAERLDLDIFIESGPLVVEWAERIESALPAENLWVSLRMIDLNQRDLIFSANGSSYENLLISFRQRIYGGL